MPREKEADRSSIHYENQKIVPVEIRAEMKQAYIDYAMSVIVSRALPDVRDGLKPVHRRILYAMYEDSLFPDKPYRKSATTVGNVLGRYHPHGDASVYDALVRLAQDFSMRYPFVDGHGNFGSIDGDPPAAYRYTEARMSRISLEMLRDIEKDTVPFGPNFDDDRKEPQVLPARIPGLLLNGSAGIAVGMATNIPPHNLGELVDAIGHLIDHPDAPGEELLRFVQGPDFPTGGLILGRSGIRSAYLTGRGRIVMRAKTEIEEHNGRYKIVVTELPYQVNKARLIEHIAELVRDKRLTGVSFIQDESDRQGMRIAIDVKRDANPQIVLNQLFKLTQLQETFGANMLALSDGRPKTMTLREMLVEYIRFQQEVIRRRTVFELKKAREREHILKGLLIAVDDIDEVIRIIRESYDDAKLNLMKRYGLSEIQAQAILNMRLLRLQGLEREKLQAEYDEVTGRIACYEDLLAHEEKILAVFREELTELRDRYGDERRTSIESVENEIDVEDLIEEEDMLVTRTHFGYVKRVPMDTYRAQHRGGRGVAAMSTRTEDFVEELFVASTHDHILCFTSAGRVYRLKCYMIPEESRTARGTNLVNLLELGGEEKVTAIIPVRDFADADRYLTMVTRCGVIKRTALSEYATARRAGLIALLLDEGDRLERVKLTDGGSELILGTRCGKAIRFAESDARPMGRAARGVKAIELDEGDFVVGAALLRGGATLLSVTERGYGKRTELSEYKRQQRGGKGLMNYAITQKTGFVAAIKVVDETDDIMLISSDGTIIRTAAGEIPVYSRATQGVRVMRIAQDGVQLVTAARAEQLPDGDGGPQEEESADLQK